jgi:hypothetical protein
MGYRQKATKKRKFAEKRLRNEAAKAEGLEQAIPTPEVLLSSKTTRQKPRRWGFDVYITREVPDGTPEEPVTPPEAGADETSAYAGVEGKPPAAPRKTQTYRFQSQSMLVGNMGQARAAAREIQEDLLKSRQHGGDIIKVVPVPHETVSHEIQNQMQGLNDMSNLLNLAYELVVEDYINGKTPASLDIGELKQLYYSRSIARLKPKPAGTETEPANGGDGLISAGVAGSDPSEPESSADRLERLKALAEEPTQETEQLPEGSEVTNESPGASS